ncbi:MAG: prolyl oligopeptidase family serine peptidase [Gemmatimonadetes bacterium]|nr:prolyl oligopeptidase family serine peptidase [Gemmatimonadota bacterium]
MLGDTLHPVRAADYLLLTHAQRRRRLHRFQDDTLFVDAMLADLKANYLIDTKRVYLAGFSNGAEMSSRLLVERSHLFAAIAIHAGSMRSARSTRRSPRPAASVGRQSDDRSFFAP